MTTNAALSRRCLLGLPPAKERQRRTGHQLVFEPRNGPAGDVLVCLFLRGGADGLYLVAPVGDEAYYAQRPRLAVPRPDDRRVSASRRGVALDGFFALNPLLAPLGEAYRAGHLAFVHGVGSPDRTHSHFEAMETIERGVGDGARSATGWLGRHLESLPASTHSPLRALAMGDTLPQALEGAMGATAIHSLADLRLMLPTGWPSSFITSVAALYEDGEAELRDAGRETLALLKAMERLQPESYRPEGGARYPQSDFGRGLAQIAQLIKAQLGLQVACLDLGGWDSHISQSTVLDGQIRDLAGGLAAFHADLAENINNITLVAMSEFGRRVRENGGLGTDHGQATCFMLMGGGIRGGRVVADWPGLGDDHLVGPGDLRVTIDYRDLLAEVSTLR